MEKLKERHSPSIHIRALGVLEVSASGRPQTEALAGEVGAERKRLKDVRDTFEEAVMRRMAATARLNYADSLLDQEVGRVARSALALADGDRERRVYSQLFIATPSTAMEDLATPKQALFVGHLIATLRGDGYASLARFIDALTAAQAEVDAALLARQARYAEELAASSALDRACEDARRLYNGAHARLSILFPDDAALVESLFADL